MICMLCGQELPDDALFCEYCGARVEDAEDEGTYDDYFPMPSEVLDGRVQVLIVRERTGESFVLERFPAMIGRSSQCDIVISDNLLISRKHLLIDKNENGTICAEDLQTMNHSYLDGVQLVEIREIPKTADLVLADEHFTVKTITL